MKVVNVHQAKTHLSRLIEQARNGEPFIIAKAGKPVVKVTSLHAPDSAEALRTGFLNGQIAVPEDFDRMSSARIEQLFGSGD